MMSINRCFVDSSAFIALNSTKDRNHGRASQTAASLTGCELIVSEFVISETYTFMRYRMGFHIANRWIRLVSDRNYFTLAETTQSVREKTRDILEVYADHAISYCDAMSVAIMKERNIPYIFSYDQDFIILGMERINDIIASRQ